MKKIITSESVNIGHPDKTCDVIADSFLDEALKQDPKSQMAVECAIKNNKLFIYGEATTNANIDYEGIARKVLDYVGYDSSIFDIIKEISIQSPDINNAVDKEEVTANDQGIIYGYACSDTKEYMPLPITIATRLMQQYEKVRLNNNLLFADAKSQVSIEYDNNQPKRINTILLSVSHSKDFQLNQLREYIKTEVVNPILGEYSEYVDDPLILINAGGQFTIWGSYGDSGCVGRKIVVDTYGGVGHVGGGCFSSKNSTKVDRSAAYYLRYVAKNIVAHDLASEVEIQISYGFGLTDPISLNINTFGTEKVKLDTIYDIVNKNFDFHPQHMIDELGLNSPIYAKTACYGHFGRDFPWEKIIDLKM